MKQVKIAIVMLLLLVLAACQPSPGAGDGQQAQSGNDPDTVHASGDQDQPEAVLERMLSAFNNHDVDAVVATYSPDIEVFVLGGKRHAQGTEFVRKQTKSLFESMPELHCDIQNRIVQGNFVIAHEHLTASVKDPAFDQIVIYEVRDGRIRRYWAVP